jgi:hypothetical protein
LRARSVIAAVGRTMLEPKDPRKKSTPWSIWEPNQLGFGFAETA